VIDPENGSIVKVLDLSDLPEKQLGEEVLNGIAFDENEGRIFVTGKRWNTIYEIKIV